MPDEIYVSPAAFSGAPPNVVLVGGVCYRRIGPRDVPPTVMSVAAEFTSCEACEVSPTSSSSSSFSSSSSASPLPVPCDTPTDEITVVISGVTSCGCENCAGERVVAFNAQELYDPGQLNGSHTVSYHDEVPPFPLFASHYYVVYSGDYGKIWRGSDSYGVPWGEPNTCGDHGLDPPYYPYNTLVVWLDADGSGWGVSAWYYYCTTPGDLSTLFTVGVESASWQAAGDCVDGFYTEATADQECRACNPLGLCVLLTGGSAKLMT